MTKPSGNGPSHGDADPEASELQQQQQQCYTSHTHITPLTTTAFTHSIYLIEEHATLAYQ